MKRIRMFLSTLAVMGMLTGCAAHPDLVKVGQTEQSVTEQLGPTDAMFINTDGQKVLVYSGQPFGQECWWMIFDQNGRFLRKEKLMNEQHWALVNPGVHTKSQVYQMFGKCAQEYTFRLQDQTAFMYRYQDSSGSNMAWWVQFDRNDVVTETAITLDPWDREFDHFWFP